MRGALKCYGCGGGGGVGVNTYSCYSFNFCNECNYVVSKLCEKNVIAAIISNCIAAEVDRITAKITCQINIVVSISANTHSIFTACANALCKMSITICIILRYENVTIPNIVVDYWNICAHS